MTGAGPRERSAAVLVPLFRDAADALRVVLIRRAAGGLHGGQLGFPGGKREPCDATLRDTALREAEEELGLPRAAVEHLADLPVVETRASDMRIAPFLVRIERPARWRIDAREVAEVIEPRVADLAHPDARGMAFETLPGRAAPLRIEFYRVGPHRLWGASHRILRPLMERLAAGEWASMGIPPQP